MVECGRAVSFVGRGGGEGRHARAHTSPSSLSDSDLGKEEEEEEERSRQLRDVDAKRRKQKKVPTTYDHPPTHPLSKKKNRKSLHLVDKERRRRKALIDSLFCVTRFKFGG